MRHPQRRAAGYAVATMGTVALTLGLLAFRDHTTPLSKGFGFLIVVVAAAATGGLGPGILASLLGSLTFNFFFLPPYGTFVIARAEDKEAARREVRDVVQRLFEGLRGKPRNRAPD